MKKVLVLSLLFVILATVFGGSLEPSSPPGSTMKTLDEVEPRIPIAGSDIAVGKFTISQSGSYYLTGDRVCSEIGILVEADDVTIDLGGFSLIGPGSETNYGIYMYGRSNVEIRNGTIRNFDYAVYEYSSYTGEDHRVINVRAISNIRKGFYLKGSGHLVKNCTVTGNGNLVTSTVHAIYVENGTVTGNTVRDNGGLAGSAIGINVNYGTITGNTVSGNGNSATHLIHAIYIVYGTVTGNTVFDNGDSSAGAYVTGIRVGGRSIISGNSVYGNGKSSTANLVTGIKVGSGCTVTGNAACGNGESATGAVFGISLSGNSLVDQNTAYDNGIGATGSVTNMPLGVAGCVYGNNVAPL